MTEEHIQTSAAAISVSPPPKRPNVFQMINRGVFTILIGVPASCFDYTIDGKFTHPYDNMRDIWHSDDVFGNILVSYIILPLFPFLFIYRKLTGGSLDKFLFGEDE